MIEIRPLAHYTAASFLSPLPCLCLAIDARLEAIRRLLQQHARLTPLLTAIPPVRAEELAAPPTRQQLERPELWFLRWLELLLPAVGITQVVPPVLLRQKPQPGGQPGQWRALLHCHCQPSDSRQLQGLLAWSQDLWQAVLADGLSGESTAALAERLNQLVAAGVGPKPSLLAMAREVHRRGLPLAFEFAGGMDLLWIGLGANGQRLSQKATDQTSGWGLQCAKNKALTRQLLQGAGLPVAAGAAVPDLDSALRLAGQLGYPVVSKPSAADQGQGVVTLIGDADTLRTAWQDSSRFGSAVLIEQHIPGRDYRFLVVHGTLMAALERLPGGVCGDGVQSVEALIEAENARRSSAPVTVEGGTTISLVPIEPDAEAEAMLSRQGLTLASIPVQGQQVRLRYSANFSVGGSVRECLAEVHPATRLMLEKVAKLFRLDIVGIDVIAPEISEPLRSQGGVICEVNGLPGVLPHMLAEPERSLMAEMLDRLLRPVTTVPVVAVHGEAAAELIDAIEAALLPSLPGLTVGCRRGARQGGITLAEQDASTLAGQRPLLRDPAATALLLQLDGRDLCAHGVSCARPDLLILSEPGADPLPEPWRDWLCRSARRVLCCDPAGPAPVASLQQAQQQAIAALRQSAG